MKPQKAQIYQAGKRRARWVEELARPSGHFGNDSAKVSGEIEEEIKVEGIDALLDHLRFCGAMPEQYRHDSTEEKLYSKYTDAVVREALTALGIKAALISARGGSADVQGRGSSYSLVADAKAFRLSRSAKNQKDFKIQAMDGWRGGLNYALIVCPIYQMPGSASQIYEQAVTRNVCLLSYSHLAALVVLSQRNSVRAEKGFHNILKSVAVIHQAKSANGYWSGINKALLRALGKDQGLWTTEKTLSLGMLELAKKESLCYLSAERDRLLQLSHRQALDELLRVTSLDSRVEKVKGIQHGNLLGV